MLQVLCVLSCSKVSGAQFQNDVLMDSGYLSMCKHENCIQKLHTDIVTIQVTSNMIKHYT